MCKAAAAAVTTSTVPHKAYKMKLIPETFINRLANSIGWHALFQTRSRLQTRSSFTRDRRRRRRPPTDDETPWLPYPSPICLPLCQRTCRLRTRGLETCRIHSSPTHQSPTNLLPRTGYPRTRDLRNRHLHARHLRTCHLHECSAILGCREFMMRYYC